MIVIERGVDIWKISLILVSCGEEKYLEVNFDKEHDTAWLTKMR